jgi:hypothetical protein
MGQEAGPRSPEQAILLLRIIGLSLGLGVTLFAAVSWYLQQQNPVGTVVQGSLYYNAAILMAFLAALGAFLAWRWRVAPILERQTSETDWRTRSGEIQAAVMTTWALLEAGALVDEVIYFLTGIGFAGALGVALIWAGIGLTWPKANWLQA